MYQKIRLGMKGCDQESFIGAVRRIAAGLGNEYELVCGAFSSNPGKTRASVDLLRVPSSREFGSYQKLIEKEKQLPENKRVQVISIVTSECVYF